MLGTQFHSIFKISKYSQNACSIFSLVLYNVQEMYKLKQVYLLPRKPLECIANVLYFLPDNIFPFGLCNKDVRAITDVPRRNCLQKDTKLGKLIAILTK